MMPCLIVIPAQLKSMCSDAGFTRIEAYIASGNVVFDSKAKPTKVKAELESRLLAHLGKPMGVVVRTAAEMAAVFKANPFPDAEPKHTYNAIEHAVGRNDEKMALGVREIYVHYGSGMGRSKLRIPAARLGTARNMNTVAKLAEMANKP